MSEVIVLDSHVWFWWINGEHSRLSAPMLEAIETDDRVGVSPVSTGIFTPIRSLPAYSCDELS